MEHNMFCYQCEQTAGCSGCTRVGVCGKQPDVAAMQDLLVYVTKGLSAVTTALRAQGESVEGEVNHLITLNLFTTITNANFDKAAIEERIRTTLAVKEKLLPRVKDAGILPQAALWDGSDNWEQKAKTVGVLSTENEDIRSLRELITYGLKGLSAYSKHANALLQDNAAVDAFLQRALAATLDDSLTAEDLIALTMETGKYGVEGMALLDQANTTLQNRFSPELGRRAAEIFAQLTGSRYSGVVLDRSFRLSAEPAGDPVFRDAALLSAGTLDQLYLAVRLAICDLVLPPEKQVPIVLDDALANFDDDRCAAALEFLKAAAGNRQILLFTCHSREAEFFAGDGEVSIQRLTDAGEEV